MKKILPQIAMDFVAGIEQSPANMKEEKGDTVSNPVEDSAGAASLKVEETPEIVQHAGVGVRIKSLKKTESGSGSENKNAGRKEIMADPDAGPETPAATGNEVSAATGNEESAPAGNGAPAKSKRGRKSLKETSAEAGLVEIPEDAVLFSKQYYTMGEVAEMFRVNQSLLRFWEAEFSILQPRKNKKGDRYFRPVDIKNLHLIYHLLRQRKYTIEGAKDFLKQHKKAEDRFEAIRHLQNIRAFLVEWKAQL